MEFRKISLNAAQISLVSELTGIDEGTVLVMKIVENALILREAGNSEKEVIEIISHFMTDELMESEERSKEFAECIFRHAGDAKPPSEENDEKDFFDSFLALRDIAVKMHADLSKNSSFKKSGKTKKGLDN